METRRWINQGQRDDADRRFLLYFNAVFTLILAAIATHYFLGLVKWASRPATCSSSWSRSAGNRLRAGGYLIANERKWGTGWASPPPPPLSECFSDRSRDERHSPFALGDFSLISLLFDVALFALLVHPQSRDYERIWFK